VRSTTQLRVRFADTDAAGIVYYATYLAYLEAGRAESLRRLGLEQQDVVAFALRAPLLEASIRYRASARFDDLLEVETWVSELGDAGVGFAYELRRPADGVVIATARTLHRWTEPAPPPPRLRAALEHLREAA
jgi:acyl-CoA thioester hydrolase